MQDKETRLTREEIYERVWSKPLTQMAKELGISDVAVAKICKKLNIPRPYRGYWRQLQVGRQAQKPPLPTRTVGIPNEVVIRPNSAKPLFQPQSPETLARIESETQPTNRIQVAEHLRNAHSLVLQTRGILEKAKSDAYGLLQPNCDQTCLDIRVSKSALRRALRIMDALLKALEARGYSVEILKKDPAFTHIIVQDQKLRIFLAEKTYRSENVLTKAGKGRLFSRTSGRWAYIPSGKLVFTINEYWAENGRKRWADKIHKPLEDQLNEVVTGIIIAGEGLRLRAIELQEQQRKWHESLLRRQEEEQRRKSLESLAELWIRTQNVRAFIKACEVSIVERGESIAVDSQEALWLAWAINYVDRLDPIKNGNAEKMVLQFRKTS